MNTKILLTVLLVLSANLMLPQPGIEWQKCYGGSSNLAPSGGAPMMTFQEGASAIEITNDGGYIVAGWTNSNDGDVTGYNGGQNDYWVIKLDSSGVLD